MVPVKDLLPPSSFSSLSLQLCVPGSRGSAILVHVLMDWTLVTAPLGLLGQTASTVSHMTVIFHAVLIVQYYVLHCAVVVPPDLLTCSVTLRTASQEVTVDCANSSSPLFTNILPQMVEADWTADFLGPSLNLNMAPAYVNDTEVGVASSNVHTSLFRAASE